MSVRIPLGDGLTRGHRIAVTYGQFSTVRQLVEFALTAVVIRHCQCAGTRDDNQLAIGTFDRLDVVQTHAAAMLDLDTVHGGGTRSGTTDVEGTHGQLGTRLTDGLCRDDTDGFTDVDLMATRQVTTVTGRADTVHGFTTDGGTHDDLIDTHGIELCTPGFVEQRAACDQDLIRDRIDHVLRHDTTQHTLGQRDDDVAAFDDRVQNQTFLSAAIRFGDDQILGNIDQTTGQVTGVGGLQCRIRQTLTGTVRGDEVLEYVQTFTEVGGDRRLDDRAIRLGHQATHTSQLTNLCGGTTRTGVGHDEDAVEGVLLHRLAVFVIDHFAFPVDDGLFRDTCHHLLGDTVVGTRPDIDDLVVLLARGHETGGELVFDLFHFVFGRVDDDLLRVRDDEVVDADGGAGPGRETEAGVHQLVSEDDGVLQTDTTVRLVDQTGDGFLLHHLVDQLERHALRQNAEQQCATDGGVVQGRLLVQLAGLFVLERLGQTDLDHRVQVSAVRTEGTLDFTQVREGHALTLGTDLLAGHVVQTQHDVLGRHDDRLAVGRRQHVVGRHHQRTRFQLGFQRQRYVDSHLVTIKVSVIRSADQRVQLDGLAFDQQRLERLDTQTVQSWGTVQQHRVLADDVGEEIPDFRGFALDHLLGGLDGAGVTGGLQLGVDERLEQLKRHLLRQTALVQTQGRADGDDGTTGIVDALAQQVLTETTLLALDHVGQRLQRTLVGTSDGATATTVVEQCIHGFLQHALLVAHDDVRRIEVEQTLEAVVAVDHTTIQIVQIRGREAAAVQRYQRTQVRRQHWQHFHDHPARLVAGIVEGFQQLEALGQLLDLGLGVGLRNLFTQALDLFFQLDVLEQRLDGFGTHAGIEIITEFFQRFEVLLIVEQMTLLEGRHARIDDHEAFEVQHALDITQSHVEQHADTRRQRLQEPDMRDRARQFDVSHTLTTHCRLGHFNATLLTDDAAMLHPLVLATQALVVLHRAKDLGTEKTITFRLECPVVDGFRLLHFTKRPRANHVRRRQGNLDGVEFFGLRLRFENFHQIFHGSLRCGVVMGKAWLLTPGFADRQYLWLFGVSLPAPCRYPASGFPSPAR